jgi:hypothetical protein
MNNSGITNFNVLNTNALYIQGIKVDFGATSAYLQGEIDAIEQQLVGISAITNRIDFNQPTPLVGNLVITEENKNSVLLTAIQNINTQIGSLNKLDLTALPAIPAGACVITPTTTNQALKTLIDNIDVSGLDKFDLTAIPAVPAGAIVITPTTTNQALKALIDTNTTDITTINGQITTINNSITAINLKLAHFSTFNYGADVMSGIADGTGFAAAVTGGADYPNGNGIWVRPNSTSQTEQIVMATAYGKEILVRGGNAVKIYGGDDGSISNRNRVELGDATDVIAIGINHGGLVDFPEIEIGCDGVPLSSLDSSTTIKGDLYFSDQVSTTGIYNIAPYTPVMVADTSVGVNFGNCNNFTTDPTFSGLDVIGAGAFPITLSAVTGIIAVTALAGGITLQTAGGLMSLSCGAGGFLLNTGAGVMNMASGSAPINMTTATADINLSAGQGTGGSSGSVVINPKTNVIIQPDTATEIYKASFLELLDNAGQPAVTANRLYQQADALYWNGQLVQGGAGNQYVLKAGDTMTGALTLPETISPIITLTDLATAPNPTTNRLYMLNGALNFNGAVVGGGGGAFLPLAGGTMTGALNSNYDAGQILPQLQLTNTNNTAPVGGQGAAINLRNDATGTGSIGERCGKIDFAGKDSAGGGGRTYAAIQGYINDPTAAAIDGRLSSFIASNNTLTEVTRLVSTSTGVRQMNINATNTTIGLNSLGSTNTQTLSVIGTQAITTSLDVPVITNAAAIYPATSTTLVDGAVRQYRPERLYKVDDYPSPLTAPTMDGEKVFILNKAGTPAGVDQIWSSADFPAIGGATCQAVLRTKYVDKTNGTPAANYVATLYTDGVSRIFVQADIAGSALTMTLVCAFSLSAGGQTIISDMLITSYGVAHRLYCGGGFNTLTLTLAGGNVVTTTNFSGQIINNWTSTGISSQTHTPMTSNATTQDATQGWSGIQGLNSGLSCIVDMTGNSAGFAQPSPPPAGVKYDSLVIGGNFTGINDPTPQRPLKYMAYYDWANAGVTTNGIYSPTGLLPNQTSYFYAQLQGQSVAGVVNGDPVTKTYVNIAITATIEFLGAGAAPAPQFATCVGLIKDYNLNLYATGTPQNIYATGSQQLYTFDIPNVTLQGGNLGQGYDYFIQVTNINDLPANSVTYLADNLGNLISSGTGTMATGAIGWRTFENSNWATPVGGNFPVMGAAAFSNGYIGFAYNGTQVTTASGILAANYYFAMSYASGLSSFSAINSDDGAIEIGASIFAQTNSVSGGNPVLPYGAGNAIGYGEIYLNNFTLNGSINGINFRTASQDPYVLSNNLIVTAGTSLSATQLLPQFGTAIPVTDCWRDDVYFPNMYFIAAISNTQTATLPWTAGTAPNYGAVSSPAGGALPCRNFGGYSDEVGYQGLVISGGFNGWLYKAAAAGELVVELVNCVVRTSGDNGSAVIASNKLTFPAGEDGTSIMLLGDTQLVGGKASWWAVSQDGIVIFDTTTINSRGDGSGSGITSVTTSGSGITATTANNVVTLSNTGVTSNVAGTGISVSSATGDVTITNSGVTEITAGTGITISGATGNVTINASGAGVSSLAMFPYVTGNMQNIVISPFQTTTGALQIVNQPTKVGFFAEFTGFGEYGQLHITNGQSIFTGTIGADANGFIPATPVQFFANIIPTYYTNTSKKVKFTCSISFNDIGGGFNSGNHYMYLAAGFYKNIQPTPAFAQPMMQTSGVACYGSGSPITNLYSIGASWTDMFSLETTNSQSNQIFNCNQFYITAYTNYPIPNTTGYMFWEIEYVTDP